MANELGSLDPLEWTLEQHKKLELFQRYKTTAERAFSRFYNMLRALRKDRFREDMAVDKVRELMYRLALESRENEQRERNQQRWERAQKPNQAKVFFAGQNMGPTREGVPNLPRPKEQGGCDCEVCRNNQAYLDRQAAKGMQ